ncbi:hypothetical protein CRUP_037649 [Coryphaenoides rupestris]|nr:hypothetical protein CRUP_037649 [Coryphaenoides rupestris]
MDPLGRRWRMVPTDSRMPQTELRGHLRIKAGPTSQSSAAISATSSFATPHPTTPHRIWLSISHSESHAVVSGANDSTRFAHATHRRYETKGNSNGSRRSRSSSSSSSSTSPDDALGRYTARQKKQKKRKNRRNVYCKHFSRRPQAFARC